MHPVLLKLGPVNIYSYGLMVALGFSFAIFLIYKRAPEFNLNKNDMSNLAIIILMAGFIGARALYIALNFQFYMLNPLEIPNLSRGGLVWYGGLVSSLGAVVWYVKRRKLNFWTVTDLMAPYAALVQSFGRIGCFLNGCCYGIATPVDYPLAVVFPQDTALLYPTQIFSSISLVAIFVILRAWQDRRHFNGEIFLGYCLLYSLKRFLMEFLRGDNPKIAFGLSLSQLISISAFLIAIIVFLYKRRRYGKRDIQIPGRP